MKGNQLLNIILAIAIVILSLQLAFKSTTNTQNKANVKNNSEESTIDIIHKRKSVRHFTNQKIEKHLLETVIKAGMAAPTAINIQPWAFIAIDDRQTLDELGEVLPYAKMIFDSPAAIVVCGDLNKAYQKKPEYWIQDCSAATQNILLAAESLGLGAVWTAAYPEMDRVEHVQKILNLPESIIPLNVIPIGYSTGQDKPKDKWKPENLHWQKW
ncbi:MAG: nitroreductase family protein [Hyphomicrobiales bacterium]